MPIESTNRGSSAAIGGRTAEIRTAAVDPIGANGRNVGKGRVGTVFAGGSVRGSAGEVLMGVVGLEAAIGQSG